MHSQHSADEPNLRGRDNAMELDHRENLYNTSVLVGNWFEERMSGQTDPKAIAPALYAASTCINDKSVYQDNYQAPVSMNSRQAADDFLETKLDAFRNRLQSKSSNIRMQVDETFMRNMTTMKDIKFRLEPEEYRETTLDPLYMLQKKQKKDLLRSYGNQTETGLLRWMRCEEWRDKNDRLDMSVYKKTFVPKKPIPNKLKKKPKC